MANSGVVFEDNSLQCKNVIKEKALIFLKEAGNLIISDTVANQDKFNKTGQTAGSWEDPVIDEANLACHMGSNYENAIWEEFGTGEFAEGTGGGRKGWWVYVKGSSKSSGGGKSYGSKEEAKKACAILRKKGLDAYYTHGKHARHHFLKAYQANRSRIESRANQIFGEIGS